MNNIEKEILKQPIPDKLLVLSFDDASLSHATFVAPLLKRYGFGATFFICEFPVSKATETRGECPGFENKEVYMDWEQIKELYNQGFEIGNHTLKHSKVNKISDEELIKEIDEINKRCECYDIDKPVSFCYPAYSTSEAALRILKDKGFLWARTGGGAYDPLKNSPLLIPSAHPSLEKDIEGFKKIVDEAKDGKIAVIVCHGVPDLAHSWVSMKEEAFEEYMKYLYDNDFKVISMKQLGEYIDAEKAAELL